MAEFIAFLILTLSPKRIVLCGGMMRDRSPLLPRLRKHTAHLLAEYVRDAVALAL